MCEDREAESVTDITKVSSTSKSPCKIKELEVGEDIQQEHETST